MESIHKVIALDKNQPPRISQELLDRVDAAQEAEERALERRCLGKRSAPMFTFARYFEDLELDTMEVVTAVGKILQMKYPTSSDPWAEATEYDDAKFLFERQLELVRFPIGGLERIVAIVKGRPLPIKTEHGARYDLFLAVCQSVQTRRGEENDFYLNQDKWAAALKVRQATISAYVAQAKDDGYLRKTQSHIKGKKSTHFLFSQAPSFSKDRIHRFT